MDAPHPSSHPTFASRTPLHIGAVALKVRRLDTTADFYRRMLGLVEIERDGDAIGLGAGGVAFLRLERDTQAVPDDPRTAGLYHNAFLMPTRRDLARWVRHVARLQVAISGASDHGVSEAFYLDDPEGNGIEVYADRPPELWQWKADRVTMPTVALDVGALIRDTDSEADPYIEAPDGLRVGHIHLRVGQIAAAEAFYSGTVGLDITRSRDGATFMSSGRYHHHVGANVWHSSGATLRDPRRAGLSWFALEAADEATAAALQTRLQAHGTPVTAIAGGHEFADPWGTRIRVTVA